VGEGPVASQVQGAFQDAGLAARLRMPGTLRDQDLVDAYHALDVFAFSSKSETQGLVLAEAMAAGCPVVALDAPGARDIVRNGENGRLLRWEEGSALMQAIIEIDDLPGERRAAMRRAAMETAMRFSIENSTSRLLELYQGLSKRRTKIRMEGHSAWSRSLRRLEVEWNLWSGRVAAVGDALGSGPGSGS
jgi:glycosyltransferase involved in cell wall biosynthesis